MTSLTAVAIRNFITAGEGNSANGIYHDGADARYPTHGLGINLRGKTTAFLTAYLEYLGYDINSTVNHYIYNGTTWIADGTSTLLVELIYLCNASNLPFHTENGIPDDSLVRLKTETDQNDAVFDVVVYDAYLNGKYGITGVISNVGSSIWNKLNSGEQLALYSLNYNASSLIGNNLKTALSRYTDSNNTDKAKMLGKLGAWYEILYASNGGSDKKGVQNRRFMEANAFLGNVHSKIEEGIGENNSYITVNNFNEANVAVAFMNSHYKTMISYMDGISSYTNRDTEIVQNNFKNAIEKFLSYYNYNNKNNFTDLFKTWNLFTDMKVNKNNDSISYGNVEGSDLKDIIFLTSDQDNIRVDSGNGDDEIFGNKNNKNSIYAGQGSDYIIAGEMNDYVNSGVIEDTSGDKNFIYLGKGSDTFYGGDGIDIVDGGTGNKLEGDSNSNYQALGKDNENNTNTIYLGAGNDKYFGGIGRDVVETGQGDDTVYTYEGNDHVDSSKNADKNDIKRVYLGSGSDKYIGGNGTDIVNGGSLGNIYGSDLSGDTNTINLGGGNDIYFGGIAKVA